MILCYSVKLNKGLEFLLLFILTNPKLLRAGSPDNNHDSLLAQPIFDTTAAANNLQLHKPDARF